MDEKAFSSRLREVVLQKYELASKTVVDAQFAEPADIDMIADAATRSMVVYLRQAVAGEHIKDVEIQYPADWWEAFKDRWFPVFMLDFFPVKYKIQTFRAALLYPQVTLPKDKFPARFLLWEHDCWETTL